MPNWRIHIFIGIVLNSIIFFILYFINIIKIPDIHNFQSILMLFLLFPLTIIYSIMPDIDTDDSKIRQYVDVILILIFFASLGMYIFTKNIVYIIILVCSVILLILLISLEHRGGVHSILAGLLFSTPLFFISPLLSIFSFTAFFSHIAADGEIKII